MAARSYWKGFLRLSLVSCPVALYPATSESDKVHFHQINAKTGNRIRYRKVDEETGDEVEADEIVKGYEVSKGHYLEVTDDELEAVEAEATRTIEIEQFVPRSEIDDLYNIRPYYIAPDGKIGADAFATIRETMDAAKMVAIGRVVLTSREHMIAIEPRGKGMVATLLRYPYEVRDPDKVFDDIADVNIGKDMLDLARHIVDSKRGHFRPDKFENRYEDAVKALVARKAKGEKIEVKKPAAASSNVINLMDALKRSVAGEGKPKSTKRPARRTARSKKPSAPRRAAKRANKAG
ncbi:MAG: Ku protein [Rhizobiales bacterium]|nr:Ku protein [Hyphomicrobiales bacterium]